MLSHYAHVGFAEPVQSAGDGIQDMLPKIWHTEYFKLKELEK